MISNWSTQISVEPNFRQPAPTIVNAQKGTRCIARTKTRRLTRVLARARIGYGVRPRGLQQNGPRRPLNHIWHPLHPVGSGSSFGALGTKSTKSTKNPYGLPSRRLAALKARIKLKNILGPPPDPGRIRPKTTDPLRKVTVRTLPRDPPGEGGPRTKLKIVLSTARRCSGIQIFNFGARVGDRKVTETASGHQVSGNSFRARGVRKVCPKLPGPSDCAGVACAKRHVFCCSAIAQTASISNVSSRSLDAQGEL